jgi:uncharacterized damage-inducible protein DinB
VGAFFRSVHGTLNHLLTDRAWLSRFTATRLLVSLDGTTPSSRVASIRLYGIATHAERTKTTRTRRPAGTLGDDALAGSPGTSAVPAEVRARPRP